MLGVKMSCMASGIYGLFAPALARGGVAAVGVVGGAWGWRCLETTAAGGKGLSGDVAGLGDADALATLAQAVVDSVALAISLCPKPPAQLLVAGGGRHNLTVMSGLANTLDCDVKPVEDVGLDGDMLEAQAFAYLAVRVARGLPLSSPQTTGVPMPVTGGQISLP